MQKLSFRPPAQKTRFFSLKMAYFHQQTQNIAFLIKKISRWSHKITSKS